MKIKKLILAVFLFTFALSENIFAKALPPGTGIGDVPANVLIMLDKSGSMGWRMGGGATGMKHPYDAAADSNGDILVSQYNYDGVKKFVYGTAVLDSGFGNNGISGKGNSTHEGNNQCQTSYSYSGEVYNDVYYTTAFVQKSVVAINASTGKCVRRYNLGFYPYNMTIDQSTGYLYVGGANGFKTINLSNHSINNCNFNWVVNRNYGSTISGGYYYFYNRNRIYRSTLYTSGSRCPMNSFNSFSYNEGAYVGLEANPSSPRELWTLSWQNSRMRKITVNANGNGYTLNNSFGSRNLSASSATSTNFYYPWGMGWDSTNNRIIASDLNKGSVQIFDTNGAWIKNFGGAPTTRMQAAQAAIKSLVTDASLTSGVNFGFAYWSYITSSYAAGFTRWNGNHKTGSGSATPCNYYNCLKVPVFKGGAAKIDGMIHTVNPGGGTDANAFMKIAEQYYLNNTYTPIDKNSPCQNSYILVIGDGDWRNHNSAKNKAKNLFKNHQIKTFAVAFGTGINNAALKRFSELAKAGGTDKAIEAKTAEKLKSELKAAISQIIASKLSFTAPTIEAEITTGGALYQAEFSYQQYKEWSGTIIRTKINPDGSLDKSDTENWNAKDELPSPSSRKIWSVIPGTDYKTNYNNFVTSNATEIGNLFNLYAYDILDYHRDSNNADGSSENRRCASAGGVIDGTSDDLEGLINFVRGTDYFDYDSDCNLTETRDDPMGDVYHSQLIVVEPPASDISYTNNNQEAYWRALNNYDTWAKSGDLKNRDSILYAGSNSGVLHAIDAKNGKEIWGFVPPLIAPNLPLVMNPRLNTSSKGGSNAIFAVDGSIVSHDMYFKTPGSSTKEWHTILFVPYGNGGAGFSVLEVTDPYKPLHLYSIYNDFINNRVYRVDHNQNIFSYDYISSSYSLASFNEAIEVTDNYIEDTSISNTCQDTRDSSSNLTTSCYKSKVFTLPVQGLSKSDITVIYNGSSYDRFSVSTNSSGDTVLTFVHEMTYSADPGDSNRSSELGIRIKPGAKAMGVQTNPEYDYSKLGETWSDPRIFRIPNNGAGDTNIEDDVYVAAMGGGYGTQFQGVGSNLTIIDLEDTTNPGRLYSGVYDYNKSKGTPSESRVLDIEDIEVGEIVNSTPGSPVLITPDTTRGISWSGAMLYLSDLEGKITKFNLTNLTQDGKGNPIEMFDSTTLFTAGSSKANGRYMYHSMEATIGQKTNALWLFAGTGDYERINDTTPGVSNYMLGIKDPDFPLYREIKIPTKADDITKCKNTTNDTTGAQCPEDADRGWYAVIENFGKVTAEPTIYRSTASFPVYEPTTSLNKCSLGDAYICGREDECGTDVSKRIYGKNSGAKRLKNCLYVGQGVLSKIIVFADTYYVNIAGQAEGGGNLVTGRVKGGSASTYRSSWKSND
jgi:type IV pilus assembly protein PilY1